MAIPQAQHAPWTRKHDEPGNPLFSQVATILFPQSLEDLIEICKNRPENQHLRAAGSHWALSEAAISDHTFIETHDPVEFFPTMGRTLRDVVPGCLSEAFLTKLNNVTSTNAATGLVGVPPNYFVHFESGKRVYQLYSELDRGDSSVPDSLAVLMQTKFGNNKFLGSWGFSTLGGAGGQTVVGALSTGTHGGDFDRPPIADSVVALHVVLDGGKHVWIERGTRSEPFMTDPQKLMAHFGQAKFGGPQNFDLLYIDEALNAAMIQVGRFGIVYSAVLRVEPQYGLREELVADTWENVKGKIADPNSDLFIKSLGGTPQRFLQIAVNPVPIADGTKHQAGVMRRWTVPVVTLQNSVMGNVSWGGTPSPKGRPERVGEVVNAADPMLKSPRFAHAGKEIGFAPDEDADPLSLNLLDSACADANFILGIIEAVIEEIEDFIDSNGAVIGGSLGAAAATGLGAPVLVELIPLLLLILAFLLAFLAATQAAGQSTLGDVFDDLRGGLLNDPVTRPAGILVWARHRKQGMGEPAGAARLGRHQLRHHGYAQLQGQELRGERAVTRSVLRRGRSGAGDVRRSLAEIRDRSGIRGGPQCRRIRFAALLRPDERAYRAGAVCEDRGDRVLRARGRERQHPVRRLRGKVGTRSEHQGHPALGTAEHEHAGTSRVSFR